MNKKCNIKLIVSSIMILLISKSGFAGNIPLKPPLAQLNVSSISSAKVDESGNDTEISVKELNFTSTVGKTNVSAGIITYGVNYKLTQYAFDNINAEDKDLHALTIPITLIIPSNEWTYVSRISPGVHSDLDNMSSDDYLVTGMFTASYKKSNNLTWIMGLGFDRSFGDTKAYPIGGAKYAPNENWLLDLVFPRFKISYGPSPDYLFYWSAQPTGGKWSIDADAVNKDLNITTSALRTAIGAQARITPRTSISLEAGIEMNRTIEFADNTGIEVERDFEDASFVTVSLVYYLN